MPLSLSKSICGRFSFVVLFLIFSLAICAQQNDPAEFFTLLINARNLSTDKKWSEAVAAWEQIAERNPVNGEYIANLANAYYNVKQYDKAIEAYTKQMELGYGLVGNAVYNIACCYALLGNKVKALEWLEKAFYNGFNNVSLARTDADLTSLQGEPKYKKLLGTDDVSKMGRTEGWRYDMELLKQEVLRKAYLRRGLSLDDFNRQYEAIYSAVDKKTDIQIIMDLMKLMVSLNDGHTGLFPPSRKEFQLTLPLQFYLFKEGLYIVAADPKYKHLLGNKVVAFEKKSVEEVSKTLSPFISRDNEMGILQNLPLVMRYTGALHATGLTANPEKVELQVEDANGKSSRALIIADTALPRVDHKSVPDHWVTLHQSIPYPVPLYLKNLKALYWFEKLPDSKTVYLQWNSVRNDKTEPLNAFTDRLMKYISENEVDKLVIDLRWNNGGNTVLVPYFINSVIKNEKINKRGNLFVIIGRRTFSAAQNLATFLERQTNAIFVGEPTGSSPNFVGEEDFIVLPYSKVAMNVSDLLWQSSWPGDRRTWIAPAVYTPPTFEAYKTNRDVALEAILKLVNVKKPF
ncbi:MAG: S41 family peptidase [Bacteroidota bacterium]|nr:S41 family peptidase [Bacteroidota bacterium]